MSLLSMLVPKMILGRILMAFGFLQLAVLQEPCSSAKQPSLLVVEKNATLTCQYKWINRESRKVTDIRVSLRKRTWEIVCSGYFSNRSYAPFNQPPPLGLKCLSIPSETNVTFQLSDLKVDHTDIYFCFTEVMSPPPYSSSIDNGTIIHVKEDLLYPMPAPSAWIMHAVVGVLAAYTIVVTVALFYCWRKSKIRKTLQSDYMNMNPRRVNNKAYQPYVPTRADRLR
ncbi:T-cell-specific surface glycoprotein CD28 [Lissotriton helveticus]